MCILGNSFRSFSKYKSIRNKFKVLQYDLYAYFNICFSIRQLLFCVFFKISLFLQWPALNSIKKKNERRKTNGWQLLDRWRTDLLGAGGCKNHFKNNATAETWRKRAGLQESYDSWSEKIFGVRCGQLRFTSGLPSKRCFPHRLITPPCPHLLQLHL